MRSKFMQNTITKNTVNKRIPLTQNESKRN